MRGQAFTLIELLIVVAIIAILAAIAVPNFLEAQTRAKVGRVYADMRTVATALESYMVDNGREPIGGNEGAGLGLWTNLDRDQAYNALTTPIAYISSPPRDPFIDKNTFVNYVGSLERTEKFYTYQATRNIGNMQDAYGAGHLWYLRSAGPARVVGPPYFSEIVRTGDTSMIYDATNGTRSWGNIYRTNHGIYLADR